MTARSSWTTQRSASLQASRWIRLRRHRKTATSARFAAKLSRSAHLSATPTQFVPYRRAALILPRCTAWLVLQEEVQRHVQEIGRFRSCELCCADVLIERIVVDEPGCRCDSVAAGLLRVLPALQRCATCMTRWEEHSPAGRQSVLQLVSSGVAPLERGLAVAFASNCAKRSTYGEISLVNALSTRFPVVALTTRPGRSQRGRVERRLCLHAGCAHSCFGDHFRVQWAAPAPDGRCLCRTDPHARYRPLK